VKYLTQSPYAATVSEDEEDWALTICSRRQPL